jgi:hypothetical protein
MASTYSNLKIQLMATGENAGAWGTITNANFNDAIEQALVETATVTFASANVTLTLSNTNAKQDARALRLNLTGTTGGARDLIVPAIQKPYIVNNGTADIITVKVSGQTGVAVPAGRSFLLYNNGTDVVNALNKISVSSGGTGQNTLTAESVIIGNNAGSVTFVAPGTAGNVLTSNGSAWVSQQAGGLASGTVALFGQTSAPTGWTKNTSTGNQHAFRIVTGSVSTGGSVDFTVAFASQTPSGSVSITSLSGSAGSTTLSTPQIPAHSHPSGQRTARSPQIQAGPVGGPSLNALVGNTGNQGGGGSHDHPFSFSSATASFSGNAINLAVKYVDVIRATKS